MNNEEIYLKIINTHRLHGVVIDSNLLLLLFIGLYDKDWITKYKRTDKFTTEDYFSIKNIAEYFKKILTTPNILTEVYNLSNQLPSSIKSDYLKIFSDHGSNLDEKYLSSNLLFTIPQFIKIGLTDTSIFELSRNGYLVLTDDLPLSNILGKQKLPVINFNNIRTVNWKNWLS